MNRRDFLAMTTIGALYPAAAGNQPSKAPRWEPDGLGSIARIGLLTPDDDPVPESEIRTVAPDGISIHASRVAWTGGAMLGGPLLSTQAQSFADAAGNAAALLARLAPRVVLYAFTSSSYVMTSEADDRVRMEIERRANGPKVIATCSAAVEALHVLGARRVALIHPPWFSAEVNAKGKDYFQARGFEVLASVLLAPSRAFQEVPPAEIYEWASEKTPGDADAVFIAGNGMRSIGTIRALEECLRKPVLTANQVLVWQALRVLGATTKSPQYGTLFTKETH